MTITKGNGGYIIDAIVTSATRPKTYMSSSWLETKQYIWYTKKEAIAEFKKYLKDNAMTEVK